MLAPALERSSTDSDTQLDHRYCECDEDTSLCGLDISGLPFVASGELLEVPCVVCTETHVCRSCGAELDG